MTDQHIERLTAKAWRARNVWVNANERVARLEIDQARPEEIALARNRRATAGDAWERAEAELAAAKPTAAAETAAKEEA